MRMTVNSAGEPRQIKTTLRVIFDNRQPGDILMDVVEDSWEALQKAADDRDAWKLRVRRIKDLARATTKSAKRREAATVTHQLQSQRFTFVPQPSSKPKHRVTQATVNAFFEPRKRLCCKPIGWKPELAAYFKPRDRATINTTTVCETDS